MGRAPPRVARARGDRGRSELRADVRHPLAADYRLVALEQSDPIVRLLITAPRVGPVTAAAFVSTIDDITRFQSAHELEAYLGLVPSERSSGERRQLGHITKAGNTRMRWLLVEAAWCILPMSVSAVYDDHRLHAEVHASDRECGHNAVRITYA